MSIKCPSLPIFLWVILLFFMSESGARAALVLPATDKHSAPLCITVVFDYQCPHSLKQLRVLETLQAHTPNLTLRLLPVGLLNRTSLVEATALYAFAVSHTQKDNGNTRQAIKTLPWFDVGALHHALIQQPYTNGQVSVLLTRFGLTKKGMYALHTQAVKAQLIKADHTLTYYHATAVPLLVLSKGHDTLRVFRGQVSESTLTKEIIHAMV